MELSSHNKSSENRDLFLKICQKDRWKFTVRKISCFVKHSQTDKQIIKYLSSYNPDKFEGAEDVVVTKTEMKFRHNEAEPILRLCAHVHLQVARVYVCERQSRQQMSLIYSSSQLLSQACLLDLEHPISAKLAGQQVPRIPQSLPSWYLDYSRGLPHPDLMWVLWVKRGSSFLHSKYLTD